LKAWNKQEEAELLSERRLIATPTGARSTPLTADLGELAIADLLQTLVRAGKDAVVSIRHDGSLSQVWCEAGRIVDADSPPLSGAAALGYILSIRHGQVTAVFERTHRPVTIHRPLEAVILEHVRRLDDAGEGRPLTDAASTPSAEERVHADPPPTVAVEVPASESWPEEVHTNISRSGFRPRVRHARLEHWQDALIAEAAPFAEDEPTAKQRQMSTVIQKPAQHPSSSLIAPKRRRGLWLVVLGAALGAGFATWQTLQSRRSPATLATSTHPVLATPAPASARPLTAASPQVARSIELDVSVEPERAELSLDGTKIAVGHALRRLEDDGREHLLDVSADGYLSQTLRFTHLAPSGHITLVRKAAPSQVEPHASVTAMPPASRSRRPKPVHSQTLGDAVKTSAVRETDTAPLNVPKIRVIEGAEPKIKILK
jgi:hypothetical protein